MGFRFTIIPKTSENKGPNFLDKNATEYLSELQKELQLKNVQLDKPLAFLLNPPYKNTDENKTIREDKEANYTIDKSILQLTGDDAGKERYLAFLGQILNICEEQVRLYPQVQPVVMIFTPTSWLYQDQLIKHSEKNGTSILVSPMVLLLQAMNSFL